MRLEELAFGEAETIDTSFNSLLVRLEVAYPSEGKMATMFQFLIGAIGRTCLSLRRQNGYNVSIPYWCDWKCKILCCNIISNFCFNSLLVRLEVALGRLTPYRHLFQFLIGAIGSRATTSLALYLQSFNSLLVRLEEHIKKALGFLSQFQFLIGAIGRFVTGVWKGKTLMFQFLIGAIGRGVVKPSEAFKKVSIPYWCDWKCIGNK